MLERDRSTPMQEREAAFVVFAERRAGGPGARMGGHAGIVVPAAGRAPALRDRRRAAQRGAPCRRLMHRNINVRQTWTMN